MSSGFFASFRSSWQLIRPYWVSDDRWKGRGLLAVIVALALGQVYVNVLVNQWNATFYNALQDKNLDLFFHQVWVFSGLAAAFIATAVYRQYFNQMLHIRWRSWLTVHYRNAWLSDRAYYRLQAIYKSTDNPDQRIADDIDMFTGSTLSLSIGLLSACVTLASFITILWGLSGALEFMIGSHAIVIRGYMVWVALIYAVLGTWLTHFIGKKLVRLNYDQQRFEADFRFAMVRLRENAEAIAFYRGEAVENATLGVRFSQIMDNWWRIMRKQKQLTWFTAAYGQIAIIFPILVAAPRYFSGAIQLGGLMQTASAFNAVQGALSWFIDVYSQFATWRATSDRLNGFALAIERSRNDVAAQRIIIRQEGERLLVNNLSLNFPDGTPLLDEASFALSPGDRLLLTGPSGCGKTTLLRALGGLWPYGKGEIIMPVDKTVLFVPQKPYLPLLSLKEIVCYPQGNEYFSEIAVSEALAMVGLEALIPLLDIQESWSQRLSIGEQQKLSFARLFLHKPDIVLLDEVTASLDEVSETKLYEALKHYLPKAIVLSTGHRPGLHALHAFYIDLGAGAH